MKLCKGKGLRRGDWQRKNKRRKKIIKKIKKIKNKSLTKVTSPNCIILIVTKPII